MSTGEYSDPEAAEWIATSLIERRNRIGRTYLPKLLPLDRFRIESGQLRFDNLAAEHGFAAASDLGVRWLSFDNETGRLTRVTGAESFEVPRIVRDAESDAYFAARISGLEADKDVTVYVRKEARDVAVVGVERSWPGKVVADPEKDVDTGRSRYTNLTQEQKALFEDYAGQYAERRGREVTPQEYFDSLTVSERTTFEAVTNALMKSDLSDANGDALGTAFDLVSGIERIAGQYCGAGRGSAVPALRPAEAGGRGDPRAVDAIPLRPREHRATTSATPALVPPGRQRAEHAVLGLGGRAPAAISTSTTVRASHLRRCSTDTSPRPTPTYGQATTTIAIRAGGTVSSTGGRTSLAESDCRRHPEPTCSPGRSTSSPRRYRRIGPRAPLPQEMYDAAQEFLTDWLVRAKIDEATTVLLAASRSPA